MKRILLTLATSVLTLLPVTTSAFDGFPAFPVAFWGTVTLNSSPAPVGTVVRAYYGSVLAGTVTVQESGIYGYTESTKQKLIVGEGLGQLSFTVQSSSFGNGSETTGNTTIFHSSFISGSTVQKDLAFTLSNSQIAPNVSGTVTVTNDTPKVVIINPTQPVTVTINSGTNSPTIDVSAFISGGTGTLPAINITSNNANNATVAIPASTVVTSASTTWDGVIAAPTVTTVTLPDTSGQTKTLSTAIEIGFSGEKLSFNKAVRILLVGQAGKRAGYVRTGISFTEITNTCVADNQTTGDTLATDGDCKIDVGSDLVIWTKHFTSFATYTQTVTPAPASSTPTPSGGGGGGGGGIVIPVATSTSVKGDATGDGKIDVLDFNSLLVQWGKTGINLSADLDKNGVVDILDFNLLLINWSK